MARILNASPIVVPNIVSRRIPDINVPLFQAPYGLGILPNGTSLHFDPGSIDPFVPYYVSEAGGPSAATPSSLKQAAIGFLLGTTAFGKTSLNPFASIGSAGGGSGLTAFGDEMLWCLKGLDGFAYVINSGAQMMGNRSLIFVGSNLTFEPSNNVVMYDTLTAVGNTGFLTGAAWANVAGGGFFNLGIFNYKGGLYFGWQNGWGGKVGGVGNTYLDFVLLPINDFDYGLLAPIIKPLYIPGYNPLSSTAPVMESGNLPMAPGSNFWFPDGEVNSWLQSNAPNGLTGFNWDIGAQGGQAFSTINFDDADLNAVMDPYGGIAQITVTRFGFLLTSSQFPSKFYANGGSNICSILLSGDFTKWALVKYLPMDGPLMDVMVGQSGGLSSAQIDRNGSLYLLPRSGATVNQNTNIIGVSKGLAFPWLPVTLNPLTPITLANEFCPCWPVPMQSRT